MAVRAGVSFSILTDWMIDRLTPEGMGIAEPREIAVIGHLRKASTPISVTELGMTTSSGDPFIPSEVQLEKAREPIFFTDGGTDRRVIFEQPSNADVPIDWREEGREMALMRMQPLNALSPMEVSAFGRMIED
jgi:hypothetical protein